MVLRLVRVMYRRVTPRFFQASATLDKIVQYKLSDIGEGIREVVMKDWFVKVGDRVAQFDNICLVESDKASVTITSRYDGVVTRLYYKVNDVAYVGKPLVDIEVADGAGATESSASVQSEEVRPEILSKGVAKEALAVERKGKALATPAVRRIAMEHKVKLSEVQGTGAEGRVLKEDVLKFVGKQQAVTPAGDQTRLGGQQEAIPAEEEKIPISGVLKVMVRTMTRSNAVPTFTYCDEVDITRLAELRDEVKGAAECAGVKLSFVPFFIKALSRSLREYPLLNSRVDEACENITMRGSHNVGLAMDTPSGLVVPNVKAVQGLTVLQIARELNRLQEDGRRGTLKPADLAGGTITLSNIGAIGGTYAGPLILTPELVIGAIGKIQVLPRYDEDGELARRHIICVSWAADHRVIDGATMARFSNLWKGLLANPAALILGV